MNEIIVDGPILSKVLSNSNFYRDQKKSNIENAKKIYQHIPNSANNYSNNVGLVVGKIQSGKTANIITLSALAFDNDCRLIIMMLSDTTNLFDQNYDRIKRSFEDCKDVLVFNESANGDFESMENDDLKKLYDREKKIIICSLKHYKRINAITDRIISSGYDNDYSIIIDDEGDDISQNTSKEKIKIDENGRYVENKRSTNNGAFVCLKNSLSKCGYISLTATPEAPLFLQQFQSLSPNYCVTLHPGIGYTGLTTFHQYDSNYVKIIDDYKCLVTDSGIPDSLIEAVAFFFAGCIYRLKKNGDNAIHSMMIHPAKEIFKHDNVYNKLNIRLKIIEKSFRHNDSSGQAFYALVGRMYKTISNCDEKISYNDLEHVFNNYNMYSINGNNKQRNINRKVEIFPYNIFIGGDLLDRGITIPNLAVSYIIRDSEKGQIDTLLQRARWFGYKENYIETCRVYMPDSLSQKYSEILETEESLWDFLEECSDMNYDLKNCEFALEINSTILNPTSSSKALYEFGYSNFSRIKPQRNFTINPIKNNENISLVDSVDWTNSHILSYNENQIHRYVEMTVDVFKKFIDNYNFSDYNKQSDSLDKETLLKHVEENIKKYNNTVCLIDMRYKNHESRTVYNENCIRSLMQGSSVGKDISDDGYYYGDRYLPEMKNRISIQVHHVHIKNSTIDEYKIGDEVIMLVLCMPKDYIVKNYVTRKNITDIDRVFISDNFSD